MNEYGLIRYKIISIARDGSPYHVEIIVNDNKIIKHFDELSSAEQHIVMAALKR